MICEKFYGETTYASQYAKRFHRFKKSWCVERRKEQRKRVDELIRLESERLDKFIERFYEIVMSIPEYRLTQDKDWNPNRYRK